MGKRSPTAYFASITTIMVLELKIEVSHPPDAELRVILSIWSLMAGGGINPDDALFISGELKVILAA